MGLQAYLALAAVVFSIGLFGVVTRRNTIGIFLGVELMQKWAQEEKAPLGFDAGLALKRARQDEGFIDAYEKSVRSQNSHDKMDFDLRGLYTRIQEQGWNNIFKPLPADHPLMIIKQHRTMAPA